MRPRVFPAEDVLPVVAVAPHPTASMRPRVFPAEDMMPATYDVDMAPRFNEAAGIPRGRRQHPRACHPGSRGFNEAAGIPRGRRPTDSPGASHHRASMRPRVFPAEDTPPRPRRSPNSSRFNEAAGIPRGRLWRRACWPRRASCFNEAAGIPRGRRAAFLIQIRDLYASMRPRVFPAEDSKRRCGSSGSTADDASMRPRVFPAEDTHGGAFLPLELEPLQ